MYFTIHSHPECCSSVNSLHYKFSFLFNNLIILPYPLIDKFQRLNISPNSNPSSTSFELVKLLCETKSNANNTAVHYQFLKLLRKSHKPQQYSYNSIFSLLCFAFTGRDCSLDYFLSNPSLPTCMKKILFEPLTLDHLCCPLFFPPDANHSHHFPPGDSEYCPVRHRRSEN